MRELRVVQLGVVPYEASLAWQKDLHRRKLNNEIPDCLLLLEHDHVYSLGRKFKKEHLLVSEEFLSERGVAVFESDRGGSITYHGPGQLIGYPILDLRREDQPDFVPDPLKYLRTLEEALINGLRSQGIVAQRREGLTGVWVGEEKIASIGVNITRGVTKHGFGLNVSTDLSFFEGMVPCGIDRVVMTSVDRILKGSYSRAEIKSSIVKHFASLTHRRLVDGTLADLGIDYDGVENGGAKIQAAEVIPFPKTSSG